MKVVKLITIALFSVVVVVACSVSENSAGGRDNNNLDPVLKTSVKPQTCSNKWFTKIENQWTTGDGQGHGPDLGSSEWRSVIEFKLGIRGDPSVPPRNSELWCAYINKINSINSIDKINTAR